MADLHQLEFFLLGYAGDATKGESINLGVVAVAPEGDGGGFADVRFIRNWRRLQCFDPLADTEEVQAIEHEIRRDLQDPQRRAELLKRVNDAWSNAVQVTALQGCLSGLSPALELERLSAIYLETPAANEGCEVTGRQRMVNVMREEFEKAGVLGFMQTDIAVAQFTKPGDPLKLDFGYAAGADYKFLHAVSLAQKQSVEHGMVLAARFPQIAAGMQAKRNAKAWLTAVVDDEIDRSREEVNFALEMMKESGIVVVRAAEMPGIAEGIRAELRL